MKQDSDWTLGDGKLNEKLYYTDCLHLNETGNEKFAKSIADMLYKVMEERAIEYSSDKAEVLNFNPDIFKEEGKKRKAQKKRFKASPVKKDLNMLKEKFEKCDYVHRVPPSPLPYANVCVRKMPYHSSSPLVLPSSLGSLPFMARSGNGGDVPFMACTGGCDGLGGGEGAGGDGDGILRAFPFASSGGDDGVHRFLHIFLSVLCCFVFCSACLNLCMYSDSDFNCSSHKFHVHRDFIYNNFTIFKLAFYKLEFQAGCTSNKGQGFYSAASTTLSLFIFPLMSSIYIISSFAYARDKVDGLIRRHHVYKHHTKLRRRKLFLLALPNLIFMLKILAMVHHNTNTYPKHSILPTELFSEHSIKIMNQQTNNFAEYNFTILALSKTKLRNYSHFFKFILILSGDISLNPGPSIHCSICKTKVNKRSLQCETCLTRTHKMCIDNGFGQNYRCKDCLIPNQSPAPDELPFPDVGIDHDPDKSLDFKCIAQNLSDINNWKMFKQRGLHFIHLNINSLLPKIDELRLIALETKAAIIGITESKIDDTVLDAEIEIEGYALIRSDRNRHGGGIVCYIRDNINYNLRPNFSKDFENIVLDMLLPNTKPDFSRYFL